MATSHAAHHFKLPHELFGKAAAKPEQHRLLEFHNAAEPSAGAGGATVRHRLKMPHELFGKAAAKPEEHRLPELDNASGGTMVRHRLKMPHELFGKAAAKPQEHRLPELDNAVGGTTVRHRLKMPHEMLGKAAAEPEQRRLPELDNTAGAGGTTVSHRSKLPHETLMPSPAKPGVALLSEFDTVGELGSGGCGSVSMVLHRATLKLYALKVGRDGNGCTAIEAEIFHRCAGSPYIVRCHAVLRTASGDRALLLELMDAGSLHSILRRRRRRGFPELALAHVAAMCVAALAYLHLRRVVHLDIKPGNLVANANGDIKICDFGLAKILDHRSGNRINFSGGTRAYESPERFGKEPYTNCDAGAADIWSVGVTLLELFSGHCPTFPTRQHFSRRELIESIRFGPSPSLPEGVGSKKLQSFLALCLQKNPKKRPTAMDLLEHPFIAESRASESFQAFRELVRESM